MSERSRAAAAKRRREKAAAAARGVEKGKQGRGGPGTIVKDSAPKATTTKVRKAGTTGKPIKPTTTRVRKPTASNTTGESPTEAAAANALLSGGARGGAKGGAQTGGLRGAAL
jgi:hypothetical protein